MYIHLYGFIYACFFTHVHLYLHVLNLFMYVCMCARLCLCWKLQSPLLLQLDTAPSFLPKGVSYPFPLDASVAKGRFSFAPPSAVKVVGSWLLRTHFCRQFSVDLAIEIPEVCGGGREWEGRGRGRNTCSVYSVSQSMPR